MKSKRHVVFVTLDGNGTPTEKLPNCPRCGADELGVIHPELVMCYGCGWRQDTPGEPLPIEPNFGKEGLDMASVSDKPYYRVPCSDENDWDESYDMLRGPGGFECLLTEPEDRTWGKDLNDVVAKLNEQHAEIQRLRGLLSRVLTIAAEAREHWDADRDMKVGRLLSALSGQLPGHRPNVDEIVAAARGQDQVRKMTT